MPDADTPSNPSVSAARAVQPVNARQWAAGAIGLPDQYTVPNAGVAPRGRGNRFSRWALEGAERAGDHQGPHGRPAQTQSWIRVTCLTGVDYFSTLGYQPAIAESPRTRRGDSPVEFERAYYGRIKTGQTAQYSQA